MRKKIGGYPCIECLVASDQDVDTLSITDLPNMVRIKAYELIDFKERDELRNGVIRLTMPESE